MIACPSRGIPRRLANSLRAQTRSRSYSQPVPVKYHPKVAGISFALSEEEVIAQVSTLGAYLTADLIGLAQTYLHKHFPNFCDVKRPTKILPLYLPTWLVDAEITAKARFQVVDLRTGTEDTFEAPATAQSLTTYYPGFSLFPISLINFRFDPATTRLQSSVADDFALLPGSGRSITCLPYTRTPFAIPRAVRSSPLRSTNIGEMVLNSSSVKFPLVAPAYPILFPVYLVQYEHEDISVSLVIEAHRPYGGIYAESVVIPGFFGTRNVHFRLPQAKIPLAFGKSVDDTDVPSLGIFRGIKARRNDLHVQVSKFDLKDSGRVREWLENMILAAELESKSKGTSPQEIIDWEDPRVRRFTLSEFNDNNKHWSSRVQLSITRFMMREAQTFRLDTSQPENPSPIITLDKTESKDFLKEILAKNERVFEETKPTWLRKWEQKDVAGDSKG